MNLQVLTFSSSTEGNYGYLQTAVPYIKSFLGDAPLNIAFIPFAAVTIDYDAYSDKVRHALKELPYTIHTVTPENGAAILDKADAIVVGGGNTFKLLHDLYAAQLMEIIKAKVKNGTPYIGWSAGANLAGATISTSNDMPIINPGSFEALEFFPFQINPHYYNHSIEGFNGETRDQRLTEFLLLNPTKKIVALPEGTALVLKTDHLHLLGNSSAYLFECPENEVIKQELVKHADLSYLIN